MLILINESQYELSSGGEVFLAISSEIIKLAYLSATTAMGWVIQFGTLHRKARTSVLLGPVTQPEAVVNGSKQSGSIKHSYVQISGT